MSLSAGEKFNSLLEALTPKSRGLVFTTTGDRPISGYGKAKSRLDAQMGVSECRVLDLRRTTASGMAALKIKPYVIEAVLNYRAAVIPGAYANDRYDYVPETREALQKWADHIFRLQTAN